MELSATSEAGVTAASGAGAATPPLRDLWYFALPGGALKRGKLVRKTLLGEPVVFGRRADGGVFALRDLCPHRGVPLSGGRMVGDEVQCPYHGWRFRGDGRCAAIPSLVEGQDVDPSRIRVRAYDVREANGLLWIWMPADPATPAPEPPPDLGIPADWTPRLIETQLFPVALDHAVVGLMDPAHGPFVHNIWFWRNEASIHEKAKRYGPSRRGFTMLAHEPSKNAGLYKPLGGKPTTEIAFELPSLRFERIRVGERRILGFTSCTPLDADATEVTQVFFWDIGWLDWVRPALKPVARVFMGQDRDMVTRQREGLKHNPRLMLIQDADTPAIWYFRLKKEWAQAKTEGRDFANMVPETTLRWRS